MGGSAMILRSVLWLVLLSAFAIGGAWVPEKGSTYLKLGFRDLDTDTVFDASGSQADGFFEERAVDFYGELGIGHRLGLWTALSHKRIENEDQKASGLSDIELGLRYRMKKGEFGVLSLGSTVKLPYLYDEDDAFRLGNGQEDLELRLLYGKGLGIFYVGAEAGYRWRTEDPSDEWRYLLEVGGSLEWFYFRSKLDGIESVDNGALQDTENNPTLYNNYDVTKWEVTTGASLSPTLGLELTWTDSIDGRNTIAGESLQLAIVFNH